MNQKIKYAGIFIILCVIAISCHHNRQESVKTETTPVFCKKDTVEVTRLTTEYLEHLKNKEFDQAIQMLHHVSNDSVMELSDTEKGKLRKQYQALPVLSYTITGMKMNDPNTTEVMYSIEIFEKIAGQENVPNTMNLRLNPQKVGDVWYLGVLNR